MESIGPQPSIEQALKVVEDAGYTVNWYNYDEKDRDKRFFISVLVPEELRHPKYTIDLVGKRYEIEQTVESLIKKKGLGFTKVLCFSYLPEEVEEVQQEQEVAV